MNYYEWGLLSKTAMEEAARVLELKLQADPVSRDAVTLRLRDLIKAFDGASDLTVRGEPWTYNSPGFVLESTPINEEDRPTSPEWLGPDGEARQIAHIETNEFGRINPKTVRYYVGDEERTL